MPRALWALAMTDWEGEPFLFSLLLFGGNGRPKLAGLVRFACFARLEFGTRTVATVNLPVLLFPPVVMLLIMGTGAADPLSGVEFFKNHISSPLFYITIK